MGTESPNSKSQIGGNHDLEQGAARRALISCLWIFGVFL